MGPRLANNCLENSFSACRPDTLHNYDHRPPTNTDLVLPSVVAATQIGQLDLYGALRAAGEERLGGRSHQSHPHSSRPQQEHGVEVRRGEPRPLGPGRLAPLHVPAGSGQQEVVLGPQGVRDPSLDQPGQGPVYLPPQGKLQAVVVANRSPGKRLFGQDEEVAVSCKNEGTSKLIFFLLEICLHICPALLICSR